jgi:hypothetical protein
MKLLQFLGLAQPIGGHTLTAEEAIFLDDLSISGPAVRLCSEDKPNGLSEDRYRLNGGPKCRSFTI